MFSLFDSLMSCFILQVQIIVGLCQPLFNNVVEDDGGLISTVARQQDVNVFRRSEKASSSSTQILDGYQETFDSVHVKQLLTEALREYNKVNPRMSITFYQVGCCDLFTCHSFPASYIIEESLCACCKE